MASNIVRKLNNLSFVELRSLIIAEFIYFYQVFFSKVVLKRQKLKVKNKEIRNNFCGALERCAAWTKILLQFRQGVQKVFTHQISVHITQ